MKRTKKLIKSILPLTLCVSLLGCAANLEENMSKKNYGEVKGGVGTNISYVVPNKASFPNLNFQGTDNFPSLFYLSPGVNQIFSYGSNKLRFNMEVEGNLNFPIQNVGDNSSQNSSSLQLYTFSPKYLTLDYISVGYMYGVSFSPLEKLNVGISLGKSLTHYSVFSKVGNSNGSIQEMLDQRDIFCPQAQLRVSYDKLGFVLNIKRCSQFTSNSVRLEYVPSLKKE